MAVSAEKITLLKEAQIFSGLNDEELSFVAAKVSLREYKKGQVILYEEDTNRYMYSVIHGEVKVFYTTEEGKESVVAFHG
nr:cyclic nucleotide-binding domain-containing protein [Gammaproteobacteria bacterium]NIR46871.1 cyclic nucleotide-binding domain-containing protein [candidate division KSB1 bacterium]NIU99773.1 cyclic nucleotide-binding domain-containing protein [Phycisphaerae bacterium]NIS22484.1 cyclic nucleotide-binding domain-containing protein [candidate division KSB1 bacterium]NIU22989.1 cyclic nucleotide-binding domain-containing protein [candidate division KSB1 bacterium]